MAGLRVLGPHSPAGHPSVSHCFPTWTGPAERPGKAGRDFFLARARLRILSTRTKAGRPRITAPTRRNPVRLARTRPRRLPAGGPARLVAGTAAAPLSPPV